MSVKLFANKLGIKFKNEELLKEALTHRSYLNEHRGSRLKHNERLEFLGDAVLELAVTEYLFANYPDTPEGKMTSWRAALVCGEMLARVSSEIGVEDFLLMSKGEKKDTGRARQYLLANALESIIGAIHMDQGYKSAEKFILENVVIKIDEVLDKKLYVDPKSFFQEKAQEHTGITPSYKSIKEWGPDHDKRFIVGVYLGKDLVAEGEGVSKQDAQREAARIGLENKKWI